MSSNNTGIQKPGKYWSNFVKQVIKQRITGGI